MTEREEQDLKYGGTMPERLPEKESGPDPGDLVYDNRSQGQALHDEYNHSEIPNHPISKGLLADPDLKDLVKESRIHDIWEADLGVGKQLGNSRSMIRAMNRVEKNVKEILDKQIGGLATDKRQELAAKREALRLIESAVREAQNHYISTTGQALPVFWRR